MQNTSYTKENFENDIGYLRNLSQQINELREDTNYLEALKMVEDDAKSLELQKKRNQLHIKQLEKEQEKISKSLGVKTPLVRINMSGDQYLKKHATQNINIDKGINSVPVYGSLLYLIIFDGPKNLSVVGECNLSEWEHYSNLVISPNSTEIVETNFEEIGYHKK